MSKFRKKPIVIDAVQWTGENWPEIAAFARGDAFTTTGRELNISTLEGVMIASPNDWIIKGVNGEIYPCKPDIFEKTYESIENEAGPS